MSTFAFPGGASIGILSPAHASKVVYLSPFLVLPGKVEVELLGHFECISEAGAKPLPVMGMEDCGQAGAGRTDTPLKALELPLRNEQGAPRRMALRLCPVADMPPRFLLFYPTFRILSREVTPPPELFSHVEGRGLCLVKAAQSVAAGGG
jgi:hypothetical protein